MERKLFLTCEDGASIYNLIYQPNGVTCQIPAENLAELLDYALNNIFCQRCKTARRCLGKNESSLVRGEVENIVLLDLV